MRPFLSRTLVVLVILFGTWTSATPFEVELDDPSAALPDMTYATVTGEVDAADNTVFHFRIELAPGLSATLNGGDRFGIVGFWFNSTLALTPAMFKNVPAGWEITASNPNCPGGCSARGSGFGEFNNRLRWIGAIADRPESLSFDIDFGSAVDESNFFQCSVPQPDSDNLGSFALFIQGFDTNLGGARVRGTFVKDSVGCLL